MMLTNEQIAEKWAEQLDTAIERHVDLVSSGECGDCPNTDAIILSAITDATKQQAERIEELEETLIIRNKEYRDIEILCRQSLALNELRSTQKNHPTSQQDGSETTPGDTKES